MHGFDIAMHVEADGFGGKEFSAEILRLLTHGLGKRTASGAANARIVDHLIGDGDLSAKIIFLEISTRYRARAKYNPAVRPAGPPPMTMTSYKSFRDITTPFVP